MVLLLIYWHQSKWRVAFTLPGILVFKPKGSPFRCRLFVFPSPYYVSKVQWIYTGFMLSIIAVPWTLISEPLKIRLGKWNHTGCYKLGGVKMISTKILDLKYAKLGKNQETLHKPTCSRKKKSHFIIPWNSD